MTDTKVVCPSAPGPATGAPYIAVDSPMTVKLFVTDPLAASKIRRLAWSESRFVGT